MNWIVQQLEISHGNHTPLRSMEGLRGIAVFLVFIVHYCALVEPYIQLESFAAESLEWLHRLGNTGVDLFFVLSGFLIYGSLIKRPTQPLPYLKRRVVRIYPTFIAVFLIYLALSFALPAQSKIPAETNEAIVFILQNFFLLPGMFDITPIITVAWSLSYEFFYYLFIPLLIFLIQLRRWTVNSRLIFWILSSIIGFALFEIYDDSLLRLMMFVSGIILYELKSHYAVQLPRYSGVIALFAGVILYAYKFDLGLKGIYPVVALFVLFLITCLEPFCRPDKSGSARLFTLDPLRWLGNMSYSYYLIHGLALKASFMVINYVIVPQNQFSHLFWWLWLPCFIVTLVVSFGLFIIVEKPLSLNVNPSKK
ncbi:acyltransferase [Pleionea sp. CnH1-48]|uniref:acyltransferase family protein n=1 Tax=Pleionea sp. CnH1-48 TaxID=2954494 RepID=UPI002097C6B7|nr:acyltransferase [Pleionea sp. CnH1-48]MCO7225185.1 acyltransferase [Pleionea sp. CnH1-48]